MPRPATSLSAELVSTRTPESAPASAAGLDETAWVVPAPSAHQAETDGRRSPSVWLKLHGAIPFLLLAVAVGIVFWWRGWNVGPVNDGWFTLDAATGRWFPIRSDLTRALAAWPTALGHAISPRTFVGLQLVLAGLLYVRAVVVYLLVRRIVPSDPLAALGVALAAVFYPADTGLFWLGALGVHSAVTMALVALYCFWRSLDGSAGWLVGAVPAAILSLWSHPTGLALLVAAPIAIATWRRFLLTRRQWAVLASFGAVVVGSTLHLVWSLLGGRGRTASVADVDLASMATMFRFRIERLWLGGWVDTVDGVTDVQLAVAAMFMLVTLTFLLLGSSRLPSPGRWTTARRLLAVGFGVIVVGLLPFAVLVEPEHLAPTRTLLLASAGAALILVAAVRAIPGRRAGRIMGAFLVSLLAAGGILYGLDERDRWADDWHRQEVLLASVVAAVPDPPPGSGFLLRFEPAAAREVAGLANRHLALTYALQYLYDDDALVGLSDHAAADALVYNLGGISTERIHVRPVPLERLLVLDVTTLDDVSLVDTSADVPADLGVEPAGRACSILTGAERPSSCP